MQTFRSIIFFILMALLVLPFTILGIIGLLFSKVTSYRLMSGYSVCIIWLLKHLCNLKLAIVGEENIPDHPVVFMAKHQSAWETLCMQHILPPNSSWIIKRSLIYVPVFGLAALAADPIAINRSTRKKALESVINQGKEKIANNRNIIVFPEGTRTAYGANTKYKLGGAKLAIATGVPVVPIAHNAGKYWKRHGLTKYPGTITLSIGKPIPTKDRDAVELTQEVKQWIESQIESWETQS
jgi:1-acyl-sn-glycerol-3-phosphate acyltransferase